MNYSFVLTKRPIYPEHFSILNILCNFPLFHIVLPGGYTQITLKSSFYQTIGLRNMCTVRTMFQLKPFFSSDTHVEYTRHMHLEWNVGVVVFTVGILADYIEIIY